MSSGLCLVTRGMICIPRCVEVLPLVSCDEPLMQEALEVRPRMRTVSAPPVPGLTPPVITSSEMRPVMKGADSPADPDLDPRPLSNVIELRPIIKDVEED